MTDTVEPNAAAPAGAPVTTPAAPASSASGTTGATGPAPGETKRPGVADALADFVQLFVDYVRQETGDLVKDKVVSPVQKAGQVVAFALAAAMVLALGVGFVAVGLLLLLAQWLTWPGALFLIGGVLLVAAGLFTFLKMKKVQR